MDESSTPGRETLFTSPYAAASAALGGVMFLTGFAALAVVPMLPLAARDLHGVGLYPLVAGCFVAASLLGGVLGGDWADRKGAWQPLGFGVVLGVLTLVVSGTSGSIWQLAAGRFLDGVAGGVIAVAVNAAVGQLFPARLQPRALALMSSCWIVPSLVGPPLAGLVSGWWSWRVVFLGLAVLSAVPAVVVVAILRRRERTVQSPPTPRTRPALPSALVVSLGAAAVQYGVTGWDATHLPWTLVGGALLLGFASRLLPGGTVRAVRGLPASVLLRGLASGTYFTLEAFVPLLLDTARRTPGVVVGLSFTGAAVAWAGASWVQGRLPERVRRERLVALGALVLVGAVAMGEVATVRAVPAWTAGIAMVVAALGMGVLAPSLTVLSLCHSPADRQGAAGSAMQTAQNLGQTVVLALASAAFAVQAGTLGGFRVALGILLIPALAVAILAGRASGASANEATKGVGRTAVGAA
ncbi:MFS transporter [Streptacidiphilus carbonis]|uniref:MFS transporter n=1 Tax=Streptacidiphilus carbonis TaxID=105422 RepID=UPI0005A8A81C